MDFRPERLHVYVPPQDNLKDAMTVPHHLFVIILIKGMTVLLPTVHTTLFISLCNNKIGFRYLTVFSHRYVYRLELLCCNSPITLVEKVELILVKC